MLIKLPLLANANNTTPGTPVQIGGSLSGCFAIRTCSSSYSAGANIDLILERAEDVNGPWEPTAIATDTITADQAGVAKTTLLSDGPAIFVRARLSASPSAGDVSVNVYIEA